MPSGPPYPIPPLSATLTFLTLYALLLPPILTITYRHRSPTYGLPLTLGIALLLLSFTARLLLHSQPAGSPGADAWYTVYLVGSLVGPGALGLAGFLTLPRLLVLAGERRGRVGARHVGYMFGGLEGIVGVLFVVGGIRWVYGVDEKGTRDIAPLVGGVAMQLATLLLFQFSQLWFILDLYTDPELGRLHNNYAAIICSAKFKRALAAQQVTSLLLLTTYLLHTIDLSLGPHSPLSQSDVAPLLHTGLFPFLTALAMSTTSPAAAIGRPAWLNTSPYRRRSSRPADIMVYRQSVSSNTIAPGVRSAPDATASSWGSTLPFQDIGPPGDQSPYQSPQSAGYRMPWTPHTPGTPGTHNTTITHHTTLTSDDSSDDASCCMFIPGSSSAKKRRDRKRQSLAKLKTPRSPEGIPYKFYDPTLSQRSPMNGRNSGKWPSPVVGDHQGELINPVSAATTESPSTMTTTTLTGGSGQRSRSVSLLGYAQGRGAPLSMSGHPRDGPVPVVMRPRQSKAPPTTMVDDDELW